MKYFLIFATLIYAALAPADTLAQRIAALSEDPDVLEAVQVDSPPIELFGFANISTVTVRYVYTDGDAAKQNLVRLVGIDHGGQNEAWYWVGGLPEVLTNTPVQYMDGNTNTATQAPYTAAEAEAFCNTKWQSVTEGTNAAPIKQFQIERIDGLTVRVYGLFNVPADATNKWQRRSYILRFPTATSGVAALLFERAAVE